MKAPINHRPIIRVSIKNNQVTSTEMMPYDSEADLKYKDRYPCSKITYLMLTRLYRTVYSVRTRCEATTSFENLRAISKLRMLLNTIEERLLGFREAVENIESPSYIPQRSFVTIYWDLTSCSNLYMELSSALAAIESELANPCLICLNSSVVESWLLRPFIPKQAVHLSESYYRPGCTYVFIAQMQTIVVSGGQVLSSESFFKETSESAHIDVENGRVIAMHPLNTPRTNHAAIDNKGYIYIFAGRNRCSGLRTVERVSNIGRLESNKWVQLPYESTESRYELTLCEHKGLIYLVCGHCSTIESFSPVTFQFFCYPVTLQADNSFCVAAVVDDCLHAITRKTLFKWEIGREEVKEYKHEEWSHAGDAPAVVFEGKAFIAARGEVKIYSFDIRKEIRVDLN